MRPLQQIERWVRRRLGGRLAPLPSKPTAATLSSIRSILLLRIDRLGDATISTPIIAAIARRFPDATIDIVLSEKNAALAPAIPLITRHHLWTKNPLRLFATFLSLRANSYDLCINLHVKPSSNALLAARVAGARIYIDVRTIEWDDDAALHIVEKTSRIVTPLGIEKIERSDEMRYPLRLSISKDTSEADRAGGSTSSDTLRQPTGSDVEDPLLINVSVFAQSRRWPDEKIERLSRMLREAGMPHAYIGTPGDREHLTKLSERTGSPFIEPSTDLLRLLSTLRLAPLVVSPDTFIVHAAAALGVPVVGLYGSIEAVTEWRPWGVPHATLLGENAVADIAAGDVFDAVVRLSSNGTNKHEKGIVERKSA